MAEDRPQIYLVTPPAFELDIFPQRLAAALDATDVACVRLALATKDEDMIGRAADACRTVTMERDVALVIENHLLLVDRHGLDGVHLSDGAKQIRYARKELGSDAIVGAYCGASRHEGMSAGEAGADYVCLGPIGESPLFTGERAEFDVFEWWSDVIEVPIVAEGALDEALITQFAPVTDFFAIGEEIWRSEDPAAALKRFTAAMG
jgi:thiamine-phosphate pyrophosphorylase